jgi:anti-sigma regulatory factor (Ser/Thr protein kinase)
MGEMCWRGHTDDGTANLSRLRKEIARYLTDACEMTLVSDVELALGELLANVHRHAPGPFCVEVHCIGGGVRLSVHDSGNCFDLRAVRASRAGRFTENGRGIGIVGAGTLRLEAISGEDGGCCVMADFPDDEDFAREYEPTACPFDHPGKRRQHCPRAARRTGPLAPQHRR